METMLWNSEQGALTIGGNPIVEIPLQPGEKLDVEFPATGDLSMFLVKGLKNPEWLAFRLVASEEIGGRILVDEVIRQNNALDYQIAQQTESIVGRGRTLKRPGGVLLNHRTLLLGMTIDTIRFIFTIRNASSNTIATAEIWGWAQ